MFLAHLSQKFKWAIVIARRSFVVRRKLSHFRFLCNRQKEFNETWQEARSQSPLPSLCFSDRSEIQDDRSGLWFAETYSTSLKPLNGIQRNLTARSQNHLPSFCCSGRSKKQDGHHGLWFADISDFSKITEQNSTKLDRKQDHNLLYQVCVFWGRSEKQNGRPVLWLAETFSTSLKPLNWIQQILTGSKISTSSTKFVFFGSIGKQDGRTGLWLDETFRLIL